MCHFGYPPLLPRFRGAKLAQFFRTLKHARVVTSLDTTWSLTQTPLTELEETLQYTDIFPPNLDEATQLSGLNGSGDPLETAEKAAKFLLGKGVKTVVITLGKNGSYLATSDRNSGPFSTLAVGRITLHYPAFRTHKNQNTTAAGDYFVAGFLGALVRNLSAEQALRMGNLISALHIEGSEIPTLENLLSTVNQRSPLEATWQ